MRVVIAAVAGLSAALASAGAQASTVLEPTSRWVVDYADNNCRLVRLFGADKQRVKLVFEQVAPHSLMTVVLVGKFRSETYENVLAFEPLPNVRISEGQELNAVGSADTVVFWPRRLGRGRWGLIPDALSRQMRKSDPGAAEVSPSAPADARAPRAKWKDRNWGVEPEAQWQAEDAAFGARADGVTAVTLNPGRSGSI